MLRVTDAWISAAVCFRLTHIAQADKWVQSCHTEHCYFETVFQIVRREGRIVTVPMIILISSEEHLVIRSAFLSLRKCKQGWHRKEPFPTIFHTKVVMLPYLSLDAQSWQNPEALETLVTIFLPRFQSLIAPLCCHLVLWTVFVFLPCGYWRAPLFLCVHSYSFAAMA